MGREDPVEVTERLWNASLKHRQNREDRLRKAAEDQRRFLKEQDVCRKLRAGRAEDEFDSFFERLHGDQERRVEMNEKQQKEKEASVEAWLKSVDVSADKVAVNPDLTVERLYLQAEASRKRIERTRKKREKE